MTIDRSPARRSSLLSVLAGGIAVSTLPPSPAMGLGIVGVLVVLVGLGSESRRHVSTGAFVLFLGVLLAGAGNASPEAVLVAATATVLSWDLGEQAINVSDHLGRAAETARIEFVHAAGSTAAGAVAVGVAYAVFRLATGGQPLAALFFLLVAALALASAIGD